MVARDAAASGRLMSGGDPRARRALRLASAALVPLLVAIVAARHYLPRVHPHLSTTADWTIGILLGLGLVASVIAHELGHATIARRLESTAATLELNALGAAMRLAAPPRTPAAELAITLAGPTVNAVATMLCIALALIAAPWSAAVAVTLQYLGAINALLALCNLVPAYPLDGGRALRALLWHRLRDPALATRRALQVSATVAALVLLAGLATIFAGHLVIGVALAAGGARLYYLARGG